MNYQNTERSFYRILMFAPAFAPLANPEAIVNSKLALAFLDAGWGIDIITRNLGQEWKDYNYGSEWVEPWIRLKEVTHILAYESGNKLYRLIDTAWSGLKTLYPVPGCRWAAHAIDLALKMHSQKRYDVIISRSLPDAGHLAGMITSRKTGLPWVANWNDPTGDKHPPPYGKGPQVNLGFFYERLLSDVSNGASWHTFPSERMRNYIRKYLKIGSNSSIIRHVSLNVNHDVAYKKGRVFTLCYAGYLSPHRNPECFLSGVAAFTKDVHLKDELRIIIIGLDNVGVRELAIRLDLTKYLQVLGNLSYKETLAILAQSDVLVILEAPCEEGIYLPAKFIDYVQTSRPILAISPRRSEVADIISSYGGGMVADSLSVEEIALVLTRLYSHWKNNTLDDRYGSSGLKAIFSQKTIISQYLDIFSRIINPKT